MTDLKCIVLCSSDKISNYYQLNVTDSDPYEDPGVRELDQKLHQALSEIFRERSLNSCQIKELLCGTKRRDDHQDAIIKVILEREPTLGKLLLERNKLSLLWIAVLSYYQDSAELLVNSGADINERHGLNKILPEKSSLLHALFKMYPSAWNERLIRLLIELGANIHAADDDGVTPLLVAASNKKADELVPLLMRHGADVKAKSNNGCNALHFLGYAPVEHIELAKVLIEKGVSCTEHNLDRFPPIHRAIMSGKIKLVNLYLDHGADVNEEQGKGFIQTFPLIAAARYCDDPAMLLTLLKRGADIDQNVPGIPGYTAFQDLVLDVFKNENTLKKMKLLLSLGADTFKKTHKYIFPYESMYYNEFSDQFLTRNIWLKAMALKKACLPPSIEFKDEKKIKLSDNMWMDYQDCIEKLNRTKSAKLIESCTFFDLLTKCQCQMVAFMKNQEFEKQFKQFDLSAFPMFAEDITEAFERAESYYQSILDQEDLIDEAVYNALPHEIVRKIARYSVNCELCELKKIVQASRTYLIINNVIY